MDKLLRKLNININPDVFCHVAEYAAEERQILTLSGITVVSDMIFAGIKHGSCKEWIIVDKTQVLEKSEEYFLDEKHGICRGWKNGILSRVEPYVRGVLHGKAQYFDYERDEFEENTYSRGELIETRRYGRSGMIYHSILFPGMKHMTELCYIIDKAIISSYTYDAETEIYTISQFNKNNSLCSIRRVKNGELHGEYIEFYPDTNKKRKVTNFIDGKEHGQSISYHENETIKLIKYYHLGREHGTLKQYNNSSVLLLECNYSGGYLNGSYKQYLGDRIIEDCYYVDNKLHGISVRNNGNTVIVCSYNMGKLNGLYTIVKYGIMRKQINYMDGVLHGEYMVVECCYTTNENYRNGLLRGTSTTVGRKFTHVINYENGLKHGRSELYCEGKLIKIVEYRMGIVISKQIIFPHVYWYECDEPSCAYYSNHKFDGLKN